MKEIYEISARRINAVSKEFSRGIINSVRWNNRLIGIRGARGIGKTTLLLQHIHQSNYKPEEVLYVSLDNLWFSNHSLADLADDFVKKGGVFLYIDEVHKYPEWSATIKNLYDDYPDLKIVFTGSSLLEILNARADLSRRAVIYSMQGLSLREYLNMTLNKHFEAYSLEEIIKNHVSIASKINKEIRPLKYFNTYLKHGYFPFFNEDIDVYYRRIGEVINMILEIELPMLRQLEVQYVPKIKQLLQTIAETAPFIPNVSKLSEKININRNTLASYLIFLDEANLTNNLYSDSKGISRLQKPNKIFLENTNFMFALAPEEINIGNMRETFFFNQLSHIHRIEFPEDGDFLIDRKFLFEIGGKTKSIRQIKGIANSYIAADQIEYGHNNIIPLWLFGFLY